MNVEYFDCELSRVRQMMLDPEEFIDGLRGQRVVLDEIHRLQNPSELLKIAADHYPDMFVLATGSSTLGASRKLRDTLAGRKQNLWLTPMCLPDLDDAKQPSLKHRFLRGGLPPPSFWTRSFASGISKNGGIPSRSSPSSCLHRAGASSRRRDLRALAR